MQLPCGNKQHKNRCGKKIRISMPSLILDTKYVCYVTTYINIRCYKTSYKSLTKHKNMQIPGRNKACQHVHGLPGGRTYVQGVFTTGHVGVQMPVSNGKCYVVAMSTEMQLPCLLKCNCHVC